MKKGSVQLSSNLEPLVVAFEGLFLFVLLAVIYDSNGFSFPFIGVSILVLLIIYYRFSGLLEGGKATRKDTR